MNNHAARDHALWSASSTARLWACSGSLALSQTVDVQEKENPAAAWGTACHEISEKALRAGNDCADYIGTTVVTKQHEIEIDDEIAECGQVYVDYVKGGILHAYDGGEPDQPSGAFHIIEQQFSLASLNPPFEAGGTADAVIYFPAGKLLEVVDLKGGKGIVVEVAGNQQLRTYALGAILANPGLDVEKVTVTIVQPRAPHKDGRIRSETFHVADLVEWTSDLLAAMWRAKHADQSLGKTDDWTWRNAYLKAGQHCRFCPAAGICPALKAKALGEARVWFNDESGEVTIPNTPDKLMPEDIARILDHADLIQDWLNAVRAYAHAQVEMGVVIPGYQLVDKQARRKWSDEETVKDRLIMRAGLPPEQIYDRKLKSPAVIEKLLGKPKAQKLLADLWEAKSSGTNLVAANKTTRAAVKPGVEKHFDVYD